MTLLRMMSTVNNVISDSLYFLGTNKHFLSPGSYVDRNIKKVYTVFDLISEHALISEPPPFF